MGDERKARRRKPAQSRSTATVDALLDATELTLLKRDQALVTTTHIAKVAGVSVGTLYEYFSSIEALLAAWEEREWARTLGAIAPKIATVDRERLPEAIAEIAELSFNMAARNARLAGGRSNFLAATNDAKDRFVDTAVMVIAAAMEEHRERLDVESPELAARVGIKAVVNLAYVAAMEDPHLLEDGRMAREVGKMISRYFVGNRGR